MLKINLRLLLFFILVAVLVFMLWFIDQTKDLNITTSVIQVKPTIKQKTILHEEVFPSISSENSSKKALPTPSFILQATKGNRALITINAKPCRWFQTKDKLIGHYTLHNIDNTLVTIFDGKGAYYEISLNDAPMEEESENDKNTEEEELDQDLQEVDTSDQTIIYADEDVSQQTNAYPEIENKQMSEKNSDQTITYGTEDISQDIVLEDEPHK